MPTIKECGTFYFINQFLFNTLTRMLVTLDVFQLEMSPLKEVADSNIDCEMS